MPTQHTPLLALPYPSTGSDLVAEGDDILRELVNRLEVVIGPPKGPASGDLGGTYPNPQVVTINGVAVSAVVFTGDARLSNSRPPSGVAGGDLAGNYPAPTVEQVNGRAKTAVVFTDDVRLGDQRTPPDGSVTFAKLAAAVLAGFVPLGAQLGYAGAADPGDVGGGVTFLLADGRLVSRVTYAAFFALAGHKYNGGVDPGSTMVRLPDKRGRVMVGADNMGTAQGAANRLPTSNRVAGQNGGVERVTLAVSEMPVHAHTMQQASMWRPVATDGANPWSPVTSDSSQRPFGADTVSMANAGTGASHPNMQPYEVDNYIVRVA